MRKLIRPKSILVFFAIISLSLSSWANMVVHADDESVSVQAVTAVIDVDSMPSLSGAIATVKANPDMEYVINIQDNITMTSSGALTVPNTSRVTISSDMSLTGAPFTIAKAKGVSGFHFVVEGTLTLENIVLDGNWGGAYSTTRYGGVDVYGTFHLNGGAVIQNCNCGERETAKGGGISCNAGSTTIVDGGIVRDNMKVTTNGGGGVYMVGAGSSFTMIDGEISGNAASSSTTGYGGGISAYGSGTINIEGGTISGNTAYVSGGGVHAGGSVTINMTGGTIIDNNANGSNSSNGGGIYAPTSSKIAVNGGKITGNRANQNGGGIYVTGSGITVDNAEITGNTAISGYGGGIYGYTNSSIAVNGGKITGNRANQNGGGIYGSGSGITASNATIAENTAFSGSGGGIFGAAGCYITVTDCRITGNSAPTGNGGGIYTADAKYAHLASSDTTVYSGNRAKTAYLFTGTRYPDIQSASVSLPGTYVLNNYDINYTGGTILNVYTVTYDANGGEGEYRDVLPALGLEYAVLSPDDTGIAHLGYTFQGWNTKPDGSGTHYDSGNRLTVRGDVILYAQWLPEPAPLPTSYAITYDANGGEGSHRDADLTLDAEYTVLSPDDAGITYPGHIFKGWNIEPDGGGTRYEPGDGLTVTGDMILYAQWLPEPAPLPITYTVVYDANGGEGSYRDSGLMPGSEYTVLSPDDAGITYPGYIFQGWNTGPDSGGMNYPVDSTLTVSGDVTLYARWSVINTSRTIEGTRRSYSYEQGMLIEIEENEVPLGNIEQTEIEENQIPMTGGISNPILIGLSCLFILGGVICRPKSRLVGGE